MASLPVFETIKVVGRLRLRVMGTLMRAAAG